jgi:16S rRNA (cytosine967-C5)-methyltransferase
MTLMSPRAQALALLLRIERGGAYADRVLSSERVALYTPRDRAFIRELVLGVLRWRLRLDSVIEIYYTNKSRPLTDDVRMILRLGLVQIMFMDSVPQWAAVNEMVDLARTINGGAPSGLVNAVLRRFLREGEPPQTGSDPAVSLAIRYSHPEWLVQRWIGSYGIETTEAALAAGVAKHPVTVRTNTLRTTAGALLERLSGEGHAAETVDGMPGFLTVTDAGGLFESRSFREGLFTAQDPAAGFASLILDPQPGERIADVCAAPGGKTTHLAELAGGRASIDALDSNAARLGLVGQAADRLGIESIRCFEGDAAMWQPEDGSRYDKVLCDVPCSGTAVFAKRPDMKWRRTADDIGRLAGVQEAILTNAACLVKPGGVVVYSTCSLEHEENEDMVGRAVSRFPFALERDERFERFAVDMGYRVLPQNMNGAGAFFSKLRRLDND